MAECRTHCTQPARKAERRCRKDCRDDLVAASKRSLEEQRLPKAIEDALAADSGNEALEKHFRERFNATIPYWVLRLKDEDRKEAIRARVESILRAELLQFERFVLLEVLDPAWKDHLYEMDTEHPEHSYKLMTPLVEGRFGVQGSDEFQHWGWHDALRIMYVSSFARVGAEPERRWRDRDLRALGIAPERARRFFLRQFGCTFQAYCRAMRLGGAMRQLRLGRSIDEAASSTVRGRPMAERGISSSPARLVSRSRRK